MATPKQMLDAGELKAAIETVTQQVRSKPADVQSRTLLFELLCYAGEWDRAEKQLDAIGRQSAQAELGVQVYRNCAAAERDRARLFSDGLHPHFLSEPPSYIDLHLDAINRLREGSVDEARALLDTAEEERPALAGLVNGRRVGDFRDYNDVTAPVLEAVAMGKYTWIPLEQVRALEVPEPKYLRDLLWMPARLETLDGTIGELYIMALYAGSGAHANDQVRLGRMTDWTQLSEELYAGVGARVFVADGQETALLGIRSLVLEHEASEAEAAGAGEGE